MATACSAAASTVARSDPPRLANVSYEVQTEVFAGPFDLLLKLILDDTVDLYEVKLADIVDAYLAELARIQATDLEVATEFLLIAATLVELKTRRLLPVSDDVDLDEELGIWEERDLLLSRLLECKTFKDAAKVIDQLIAMAARSTPRRAGIDERFVDLTPDLLAGVTPEHLKRAFLRAVTPKPVPAVQLTHVAAIKANVSDTIVTLLDRLPGAGTVSFRDLTADLSDRIDVVVTFLAVLEMFKQGLVEIDQPTVFGALTVEWCGDGVDRGVALAGLDTYEG